MYDTEESRNGSRNVVVSGGGGSLVEQLISSITSLATRSKEVTIVESHLELKWNKNL